MAVEAERESPTWVVRVTMDTKEGGRHRVRFERDTAGPGGVSGRRQLENGDPQIMVPAGASTVELSDLVGDPMSESSWTNVASDWALGIVT